MNGLPVFDWIVTGEFDSVGQAHGSIQNDSVQIDPGKPSIEFRKLVFDDMSIVLNSDSLANTNYYLIDPDTTIIALFQLRTRPVRWCGLEIENDTLLVHPSGRDYVVGLPAGYKGIHIQIANALIAELDLLPDRFMTPGAISLDWVIPAGPCGHVLRHWLYGLFSSPEELRRIAADPISATLFRDRLLGGLGAIFDDALNGGFKRNAPRVNGRYGLARRAHDLITGRLHEPISAEDLARELGVSRQVLWYAFREVYHTSPYQYVLSRKLQAVRTELRSKQASRRSIAEIAERYGFTDISRFGQFYRRQFGEVPSSTLGGSDGEFIRR